MHLPYFPLKYKIFFCHFFRLDEEIPDLLKKYWIFSKLPVKTHGNLQIYGRNIEFLKNPMHIYRDFEKSDVVLLDILKNRVNYKTYKIF